MKGLLRFLRLGLFCFLSVTLVFLPGDVDVGEQDHVGRNGCSYSRICCVSWSRINLTGTCLPNFMENCSLTSEDCLHRQKIHCDGQEGHGGREAQQLVDDVSAQGGQLE